MPASWTVVGPFGDGAVPDFEGIRTARGIDLELPGPEFAVSRSAEHLSRCTVLLVRDGGETAEVVGRGAAAAEDDVGAISEASGQFAAWEEGTGIARIETEADLAALLWKTALPVHFATDSLVIGWVHGV